MASYVLLERGGAEESPLLRNCVDAALQMAWAGHDVALLLVEHAVQAACLHACAGEVFRAMACDVSVFADERSLRERGFRRREMHWGVHVARADFLVRRIVAGCRPVYCEERS